MAIVRSLKRLNMVRPSKHTEVNATYTLIPSEDGPFLQIDTYGSARRRLRGKKSQSIRFSPEALVQLSEIIGNNKM